MNRKLMFVLAMLLVATVAFAQNPSGQGGTALNGAIPEVKAGQQISGSGPNNQGGVGLGRHDLIDSVSTQPLGCETCHLPHTAPNYGTSFMWAWRNVPTSLSTYNTATNNGGHLVTPSGISGNSRSMLCFSCHDATSVSLNGVSSANLLISGAGGPYPLVTTSGGTGSLSTQHPVDAVFPGTTDYVQPSILGSLGLYGTSATVGVDALPLWDGAYHVECGTCHDVHNDYAVNNTTSGSGGAPFLRIANINGTYLCRECHNAQ